MQKVSHPEVAGLISRLIREGEAGRGELAKAADHIVTCSQCLEELLIAVQLVTGDPSAVDKLLGTKLGCYVRRSYLWRYVEEEEKAARRKYPWLWEHLQKCGRCKDEEETLRLLVASQEKLGPLPLANTEIKEPLSSREPLVFRFTRRVRVFWEGKKSKISEVPERFFAAPAKVGFSSLETEAWLPAYLEPEEAEVQEMTYFLPEGLSLRLLVTHCNDDFEVTVTPELPGVSGVYLKLFRLKGSELVLVAGARKRSGETCVFAGLKQGAYEIHVETGRRNKEKKWEVPLEFG